MSQFDHPLRVLPNIDVLSALPRKGSPYHIPHVPLIRRRGDNVLCFELPGTSESGLALSTLAGPVASLDLM